jgi:sugar/nucleoside kinase (ribokinase family)
MAPFDLITTGRVGVDLYPQQSGVSLAEVETFAKYLGRGATNVSVQAARLAIVKKGPEGVLARTRDERVDLAPVRLDAVNGLGAGDAFGGTLAHGLARGWELERTIPTLREIDEVLHG